jgi:aminopeptidase N
VEGEAARALGKTRQVAAFETLVEIVDRPSWADVVAAGAVDGLAALRDERALEHVRTWTRYGHPTRVRRAAIMAVPKLSTDAKARELLEDLLEDSDPHLRIDVARALGELGDVKARGALRERLEMDLDARVRRRLREVLRDLGHDAKKISDQMKEDFEKLQVEQASLRARMAQLEARLEGAKDARREGAGATVTARKGSDAHARRTAASAKSVKNAKKKSSPTGTKRGRR